MRSGEAYWDRYRDDEITPPRIGPLPPERMDPHSRRLVRVSAMDEAVITAEEVRRARRAYYGAISYVDDAVGELIGTLGRFGLEDDTLVIFTADHGDMLGERGLWYKMCFFEWAVRVPLIFRAPGRFAPRRTACLASLLDLLPTLLELGRPKAGGMAAIEHDGASLAPLLHGGELPERTVVSEYLAEGALAPIFMIRRGAHKFIWSEPDPAQLFDLERDPDELENLAASPAQASAVAALEAEMHERWEPARLREEILKSQRARRFAWQALMHGRQSPGTSSRPATPATIPAAPWSSTTWSAGAASRRRIGRLEAAASSSMAHCSAATATANAITPLRRPLTKLDGDPASGRTGKPGSSETRGGQEREGSGP